MANRRSTKAKNPRQVNVSTTELEVLKFLLLRKYNENGLPEVRMGVHFESYTRDKCEELLRSLRDKGLIEGIGNAAFYRITTKGLKSLVETGTILADELLFSSDDKIRCLAKKYYESSITIS